MYLRRIILGTPWFLIRQNVIKEMLFTGVISHKLWYSSRFNSSRLLHLTRFNVFHLLNDHIKNVMCLINKKGKPWQFHLQLCCLIFFFSHNITYPMSFYLYTHWKLRSFFMEVCIIDYLLGTSQVNVYRASKKKLSSVYILILKKALPHIDNFRRTLLCDS